jgi:hypothetical protein
MMEKTPYELLNGRKPSIAYFWIFGCRELVYQWGQMEA